MTGDEHLHLLPLFHYFCKKNMCNFGKVTLVGFSSPSRMHIPWDFEFISLGSQRRFLNEKTGYWKWSDAVLPFFRKLKDEYFFLTWLEHLPIQSINIGLFNKLLSYVKSGIAQRAFVDTHLNQGRFAGKHTRMDDLLYLGQDTKYRISLMPGIWDRKYFLKYLKPGFTAWDFEVTNIKKSMNDGAILIAPAKKDAYKVFNFYLKGVFNERGFNDIKETISPEDRKAITDTVDRFGKQVRFGQRN